MILRLLLSYALVFLPWQGLGGKGGIGGSAGIGGGSTTGSGLTGTFHDSNFGCTGGGLTCTTAGFAVTAGDLIICVVSSDFTTNTLSCTDLDNDTFHPAAGPDSNGTSEIGEIFYAKAGTTNASETCTPTLTNSTGHISGLCMSITVTGTIALDKHPTGGTFTTTTALTTAASGTTSSTNEVAVSCFSMNDVVAQSGTPTAGTGWSDLHWTSAGTGSDSVCEWQQLSSTSSVTGTATSTNNATGVGQIATFN